MNPRNPSTISRRHGKTALRTAIAGVFLFALLTVQTWANQYSVIQNAEGGYTLTIMVDKGEGTTVPCKLRLLGKGQARKDSRGRDGFYYDWTAIIEADKTGDLGYAWVDGERTRIHLNLYWVDAPNALIPSAVNGCYEINVGESVCQTAGEGKINVRIEGEVVSPGEYALDAGSTLGDLLALASLNQAPWRAAKKHVKVRRKIEEEWVETIHDCSKEQGNGPDFILQNGDEILVPRLW